MRGRKSNHPSLVRLAATLLALAIVPSAHAKEKPQPAPPWAVEAAKTPTPSTAQDAAAVVLFDEYLITVDQQNHAVERERSAIRILKPQGRGYAHCSISYDVDEKLAYFHSWTFAPDGRQFQAMEADFLDRGAYAASDLQFTERIRTVNPPASDPGAVVVCETEEQLRPYMQEEDWQIQSSIPIVNEAMELALPPGGHYADSWRKYTPVKPIESSSNHLRWEIHDVPALDLENIYDTPRWSALAARMSVKWGDAAVNGADNQWRAIGLWQQQLEEHRADTTPEIAAKTRELIAGAPDLYTRLSRITDFIQKNIRYFIVAKGIGGWQAHYAADIYRNRYGDCKDKTTLLIAMLRAAGIPAYYLHVDSHRGVIDPDAPSLIGNHMITAIELPAGESDPRLRARVKSMDDKTLLIFDPTDEVTPVGLIRSDLQGAYGNISNGTNSQVLQMPVLPPDAEGVERKGVFTLDATGTLSGKIKERFNGDDAASERWFLKDNDAREQHEKLEKQLSGDLSGLDFKGFEVTNASVLDNPLGLDLNIVSSSYARSSGPLLLVRPRILGTHAVMVPDVMNGRLRLYPIEFGHPGRWHDSFEIVIPAGYAVDDLPPTVNLDSAFAHYHSEVTVSAGTLHYDREYVVRQVEIQPAQAPEFRRFESAILSDEKSMAILKKQ